MDWTYLLSPIVSAIIAAFGAYTATKRGYEESRRLTEAQLARLETEVKNLRRDVEKHNHVMERTSKLEAEVDNLYHRYDELKETIK